MELPHAHLGYRVDEGHVGRYPVPLDPARTRPSLTAFLPRLVIRWKLALETG